MSGVNKVREVLARFRDRPPIGLDIKFPVNWQMDADLANALALDLAKHGDWEARRATPSLANHIPYKTGLYMFVFRSHLQLPVASCGNHQATSVLYVGRAGNHQSTKTLKDRYRDEYSHYVGGDPGQLWDEAPTRGRRELLKRYLSIWPIEYWWLVVENRDEIAHLEDRLIKILSPPLNSQGRLKIKTAEPQPAFRSI